MMYDRIADEYPVREVLRRYGVKIVGTAYHCPLTCCRGHEASPAGSFYTGKDGRERWKCHRGDIQGDSLDFVQHHLGLDRPGAVKELTGKTLFELSRAWGEPQGPPKPRPEPRDNTLKVSSFPPELDGRFQPGRPTPEIYSPKTDKRRGYTPSKVYRYFNELDETLLIMLRIQREGGKLTFPVRYVEGIGCVAAGWQATERRRFYREGELSRRSQDPVLVVEGEKCADLLAQLPAFEDFVVIAWQGGTGNVRRQPWEALRGRVVTFWPDADKVSPEKLELDPAAVGAGEKAMLYAADKVGGEHLWLVTPAEEWIAKDCGYDAYDLVQDLGADAARAEMDARRSPHKPAGPDKPPPEPPRYDRAGRPIDYIMTSTDPPGLKRNEPSNWAKYIAHDPRFGHELVFDVITQTVICDGTELPLQGRRFNDILHELGTIGPWCNMRHNTIAGFIDDAARERPINRVLDAIRSVAWDRQRRELADYVGTAEPDVWAYAACNRWLLGLVRRIVQPGCQHDGMLVLEGEQGLGKTSFFRTMGRIHGFQLYGEQSKLNQERDVARLLVGNVVVELGEMKAQKLADTESFKGMLTKTFDKYRRPYDREEVIVPRACVFAGTTNESHYLTDSTGNRRYWIVEVNGRPRLADLAQDLPQLLSQALWDLETGAQNWLTPDEEELQRAVARSRRVEHPAFLGLAEKLVSERAGSLTWTQVYEHVLGFTTAERARLSEAKHETLRRLMVEAGWVYKRWDRSHWTWRYVEPIEPEYPDDDSDIPL